MQIISAGGALRLPADKKILRNFFITFLANVHASENISIISRIYYFITRRKNQR